jgi:hypothetical protein
VLVLIVVTVNGDVWLHHRASTTNYERLLERPVIALGALLLTFSFSGLVVLLCRASCLLTIFFLFAFTIFTFVVTNHGVGWAVSGKGYKEYRLRDYSTWQQRRVKNTEN